MQGGFSIREYASRMRSINVVNCWPFDETSGEDTVKSLLPPIVVKRFTWWLDELEFLNSETADKLKISEKKTKNVFEKGETSSTNVDIDSESGLVVKIKSVKGKMRATKKRSIVEIFAVAPPVKRAISGEEEKDANAGINRATKIKKKKKMKMKNKDVILRKALRVVKKIKRKKAAEKGGDDIGVPNKKKSSKLKLHTSEKASENSNSSCSEELENDVRDCLPNPQRKPRLKDMGLYKKFMPRKAFNLIEETKHPRGILKNQSKELSLKQSKKCILQKTIQSNSCSSKKANKHVTFSKSDELVILGKKPSQSAECFESQKEKYSTISETSGSEEASRSGKEIGAGLASNEKLTMLSVDSTTVGKHNYEREHSRSYGSSERCGMYSVDQHWSDHNIMKVRPRFLHMPTSSNSNSSRLNKDLGSTYHPRCFEGYRGPNSDVSMSRENTAINCAHSVHFQTFPHLSPNELLQTVYSGCGDIHGRSDEFVGLPLNSHGELIMVNSSAKREVDNQMINSNVSATHCIDLSLPNNSVSKCFCHNLEQRNLDSRTSQLNLFPMESYVKENNSIAVLPSRLGLIDSQSEKVNLDFGFPQINYRSFDNSEKKANDQIQKGPENEKFHATMRLMGKEFEVGGRGGIQGFEDGRMWKDKQIVDELHFQNEPSCGELRETLFSPSELTANQRLESNYALPHFDYQTGSTYKSVFLTRRDDYPQKSYSEVYNSKSFFSEPFTTGYDSQMFTLELPKATPPHQEICSINKQNLHYSPISAIKFPFMHPDFDGQANSSWARRSLIQNNSSSFDFPEKASFLGRNLPYPNPTLQSMPPPPLTPSPYYPEVLSVSSMHRKHGNHNKIKERIKPRGSSIRGLDSYRKPISDAQFKPLKRPPRFHEGLNCGVRKPAAVVGFKGSVGNMGDSYGSCSATKSSRFVMCGEYDEINKEETILPWVDYYTENSRTGSIKLSGGAKHVLKARQQRDQSSGRSTDQEISLCTTNIGFRI